MAAFFQVISTGKGGTPAFYHAREKVREYQFAAPGSLAEVLHYLPPPSGCRYLVTTSTMILHALYPSRRPDDDIPDPVIHGIIQDIIDIPCPADKSPMPEVPSRTNSQNNFLITPDLSTVRAMRPSRRAAYGS
jgi:hypothetical protein